MSGRAAKIPIARTFNEFVWMDFAGYGDYAAIVQIRGKFPRFSVSVFIGAKEKGVQTSEMVRETVILHWLAAFGAPGIFVVGKDMGYIGEIFQEFPHRAT